MHEDLDMHIKFSSILKIVEFYNLLWLPCFRANWIKELNPDAVQLYSMVADVFVFWAKSHVS